MQIASYKILILDAAQRAALACTRALGQNSQLIIYTAENATRALASESRYCHQHFQSPNPVSTPEEYLDWLDNLCRQENFSLVIPITEISSQLILMNHQRLSHVHLPFASYQQVMQLAHKGELVKLATSLNITVPHTHFCSSINDVDYAALQYPLVIKPCLSRIFTGSEWINTQVKIIHSQEELQSTLKASKYIGNYPFMLQEFIPGHGAGIFCLFNRGKPYAFFAHNRLREKPPEGGISVLSESAEINPELKQIATDLLTAANWHGVAMVEFRMNPEGKAYLMEVNTRFWGSLQLSIDAGVNFPAMLVANELNLPNMPPTHYKVGQKLRWLLGDLDSLYLVLKSSRPWQAKAKRVLQFLKPGWFHTWHEINRWNDLSPAWFELKTYIKQLLKKG
jgi:predicted ATP-grasp superfamily ATP-dependent carboligase